MQASPDPGRHCLRRRKARAGAAPRLAPRRTPVALPAVPALRPPQDGPAGPRRPATRQGPDGGAQRAAMRVFHSEKSTPPARKLAVTDRLSAAGTLPSNSQSPAKIFTPMRMRTMASAYFR
jgi:hypothetical protein